MVLSPSYFLKPATELASDLIGKYLCCRHNAETFCCQITETECYYGEEDSACHAFHGKTKRTVTLYESGGRAYIYLCYGMHHLFNIVTGPEGHPEAVLIRGIRNCSGPGRLTKYLGITKEQNGILLIPQNGLWVEDHEKVPSEVLRTPRIGISYAEKQDRERLWRFLLVPEKSI